ncbi:unnamed protein product [Amoebophrya sp. A120]|nr:unnamed protein product [Amoebophrya sp. A120]|eukprot:GSA120T00007654001.1
MAAPPSGGAAGGEGQPVDPTDPDAPKVLDETHQHIDDATRHMKQKLAIVMQGGKEEDEQHEDDHPTDSARSGSDVEANRTAKKPLLGSFEDRHGIDNGDEDDSDDEDNDAAHDRDYHTLLQLAQSQLAAEVVLSAESAASPSQDDEPELPTSPSSPSPSAAAPKASASGAAKQAGSQSAAKRTKSKRPEYEQAMERVDSLKQLAGASPQIANILGAEGAQQPMSKVEAMAVAARMKKRLAAECESTMDSAEGLSLAEKMALQNRIFRLRNDYDLAGS